VNSQPDTPEERPSEADQLPEVETDQLPRALFGYNRATIVELLGSMSNRIRELTHQRTEQERRIDDLEHELERSSENRRLIGETLVSAREEAEAIRDQARRSAEEDLRSVREQGKRIVAEAEQAANERVVRMILEAQRKRDAIILEGREARQALLDEAAHARAFVDQTHEQLSDFLMAAVRWYEQAKTSAGDQPSGGEAATPPNDLSSTPSSATASLTRGSQSTSSSSGRSAE